MKILSTVLQRLAALLARGRAGHDDDPAAQGRDPLRHPALARMDLRQLADLPLSAKVPPRREQNRG